MTVRQSFISKWFFVPLIVAVFLAAIVYRNSAHQAEYHNKIIALTTELTRHQRNREELRHLVNEARFNGLTLREVSSTEWAVETPIQFGATNWILYVEMIDSKMVALQVRTADSRSIHPNGAPPDQSFRTSGGPSSKGNTNYTLLQG